MTRDECLAAAMAATNGDRDEKHGQPEDSFTAIAMLWNAYFQSCGMAPDGFLTDEDVAVMMILLKVARICTGSGNDDNFVDIAGYAACAAEINSIREG